MFLEVKNLVKYYQKDIPVIKKLNFSVNKGEIISFLGESGSGKTTFLKCISGLETINSGSISLNNNIPLGLYYLKLQSNNVSGGKMLLLK